VSRAVPVDRRSVTRQTEETSSSTHSYQINKRIIPALILSLPLWFGLWWIASAIKSAQPTIQFTSNPTKVEVVQPVNKLDGYLPEVRK
jgi:hypothetical protein